LLAGVFINLIDLGFEITSERSDAVKVLFLVAEYKEVYIQGSPLSKKRLQVI
jgi:hypothetical protein